MPKPTLSIVLLATVSALGAGPTTKPATRPATPTSKPVKVAAQARNANGAARDAGGPATRRSRTWTNIASMFVGFPSDIQPRPGQNWENSNVTLAKDWLKSHLVGDRISIRATFEEANLTEAFARLKADVESCDSSIGKIGNKIADPHLPWKNGIHAKCPPSQFKSIAKLAKGDPVQLSGVITDLEFHAYNNVVAGNKKITMFHLVLEVEDCSIGH